MTHVQAIFLAEAEQLGISTREARDEHRESARVLHGIAERDLAREHRAGAARRQCRRGPCEREADRSVDLGLDDAHATCVRQRESATAVERSGRIVGMSLELEPPFDELFSRDGLAREAEATSKPAATAAPLEPNPRLIGISELARNARPMGVASCACRAWSNARKNAHACGSGQ
jgi:hypothetical protein